MRVNVEFVPILVGLSGKKKEEIVFDDGKKITIQDVLNELVNNYGVALRNQIYDMKTGEIHPYLIIMLNGRNIIFFGGMNAILSDGDTIVLVRFLAGG